MSWESCLSIEEDSKNKMKDQLRVNEAGVCPVA